MADFSGPGGTPVTTIYYSDRVDIESFYGVDNVAKWADLNSNEVASEITAQIDNANRETYAYFNSRLLGGNYTIPFTTVNDQIRLMSARYAGWVLYSARGVDDSQDNRDNMLLSHRDEVELMLDRIRVGSLLPDEPEVSMIPVVVKESNG